MADRSIQGRQERLAVSLAWMERYHPILDDRTAFQDILGQPPPIDLLVPGDFATVEASVRGRGLGVGRFPWAPRHLRVTGHSGAGTLPEVVWGLAFPQGVSSALPPQTLSPRAGERILDLCAAPGGKTVHLAHLAGDRARLLASDPSEGRCGLLVTNLARMAVASAVIVQQNGANFPVTGSMEAIQLDAPCTGEGTFRIPAPKYDPRGEKGLKNAAALQKRLLIRALAVLAPGGRLVYSTCSFAPEENEAVLNSVLMEHPEIEINPLPENTPGLPGLVSWGHDKYDPRLERARRIFPHHTGSWGFFLCLLSKDSSAGPPRPRYHKIPTAPAPPADDREARHQLSEVFLNQFGVKPAVWEDLLVCSRGRSLWILKRLPAETPDLDLGRLRVVAPGLRVMHLSRGGQRPTTSAVRWLGSHIQNRFLDLSPEKALALLDRGSLDYSGPERGLVALRLHGRVVALGHCDPPRVTLELPGAWR